MCSACHVAVSEREAAVLQKSGDVSQPDSDVGAPSLPLWMAVLDHEVRATPEYGHTYGWPSDGPEVSVTHESEFFGTLEWWERRISVGWARDFEASDCATRLWWDLESPEFVERVVERCELQYGEDRLDIRRIEAAIEAVSEQNLLETVMELRQHLSGIRNADARSIAQSAERRCVLNAILSKANFEWPESLREAEGGLVWGLGVLPDGGTYVVAKADVPTRTVPKGQVATMLCVVVDRDMKPVAFATINVLDQAVGSPSAVKECADLLHCMFYPMPRSQK